MARFLTTKGALDAIERVVRTAENEVVLLTPFVQLSDTDQRRLKEADARGVEVTLVCRYDALKEEWRRFFASLDHAAVYDEPALHAKCFFNERGLVLTSLNLYEYSERNHEMGVWLDPEEDAEAFRDAVAEAASIQQHAREVRRKARRRPARGRRAAARPSSGVPGVDVGGGGTRRRRGRRRALRGHCIRCNEAIPQDPARPYCYGCFEEWAEWGDPTYGDDYCHSCGRRKRNAYSKEKPECYACFSK